ncbi:hypothetical protein OROMI_009623 [Orobanche minor]
MELRMSWVGANRRLGANVILVVSLAVCKGGAAVLNIPLYKRRISDLRGPAQEFPLLRSITALAILMLRNCNVYVTIPAYVWRLRLLQMLDVNFNMLVGQIPNDIARNLKTEQSRKEIEELDKMLEENRRRVEEAQRREALELQCKEEERLQELELIQRQKEEEEERANQMLSGEDWDGICGHVFGALACEVEALGLFCSAQ